MLSKLLSVCMIVRNEERLLPDCLASVLSIAAEIIIVDTGSRDRTREIALEYGARLIDFPWQNDFSAARNIALGAAKFPWILSIDADERLENREELYNAIESAPEIVGGLLLETNSPTRRGDGSIDVFSIQLLRVFRSDPRIRFEGAIHEQVLESILCNGWKIQSSGAKLSHLGYDLPPAEMLNKQHRNLLLLDNALSRSPADAYLLFQRAKTYLALGDLAKAEKDIFLAIENSSPQSLALPQALNYGGIIAFQSNNAKLAVERAKKSLKIIANQSFANFVIGESYTAAHDFKSALLAYQAMQAAENTQDYAAKIAGEYRLPPEQLQFRLGRSYIGLGQWKNAELEFQKGLINNPKDIGCLVGLANSLMRQEKYTEAKNNILKAITIAPERADLADILARTEDAEKQQINAELINKINEQNSETLNRRQGFNYQEKTTRNKANNQIKENNIFGAIKDDINKPDKNNIIKNYLPNENIFNLPNRENNARINTLCSPIVEKSEDIEINPREKSDLATPDKKSKLNLREKVPLLSLCMIVKNEEKFLPECLKSVDGIVDEIIIVDTGSTDATIEIAAAAGATIVDFAWINDFAAARNESLRHAKGKWILYLDADERLRDDAKLHLRKLLGEMPEEIGGLICNIISPHRRLDDSSEEHRGGYPRIFRRLPGAVFQGRVHEQITPSLLALGKQIALSDVEILHLGYDQSQEILEQKTKRNYELLLRHAREEPENAYAWFQLGQTLARMNLAKQAEDALKFSLQLGTLTDSISASATAALAQLAGNARKFTEALEWADKSLRFAPNQLYARQLRAYSLHYLRRNREAKDAFLELLKLRKSYNSSIHAGFDIYIPEDAVLIGLAAVENALKQSG